MNTLSNANPQATVLDARSLALRRKIVETLKAGNRGHLASALSLVEILRVFYDDILRYDARNPKWSERDRFVLSKGHGCLALYVLLAEKGFFPENELTRFCRSDGLLGGHPEHKIPGVEASTGSLGHGMSIAIGFALAARHDGKAHRVVAVIGDGESDEGSIWEGALCAGKHGLSNLTVVVDYNRQQSYGPTSVVQELEPLADKWRAFNFSVAEVNGHDVAGLREVFGRLPLDPSKPSLVICHTVKGKGIAFAENDLKYHHLNSLSPDDAAKLFGALE
jgi:transketolase